MRKFNLREWKDLTKAEKDKAREKEINDYIDFQLYCLSLDLERGDISEEEYYKVLGCSKYYAESTGWFVPSCYYEKNKDIVEDEVNKILQAGTYSSSGKFLYL